MDKAKRAELLKLVRSCHDVAEAARMAGVSMAEIRRSPKLKRELDEAYDLASSKLRSKLLERVLAGDGDLRMLMSILEHRGAQKPTEEAAGIGRIVVELVDSACQHCGQPTKANKRRPQRSTADRGNGLEDAAQPEPAAPVKQPFVRRYGPSVRMGGI